MSQQERRPCEPRLRRRRPHRKSRQGCSECKARHIKCDERRPSCANCVISERPCSYPVHDPPDSAPITRNVIRTAGNIAPEVSEVSDCFNAIHLACLHHAETQMEKYMALSESAQPIIELAIACTDTAPFLLDQVLALSALHLSTEVNTKKEAYHRQATYLQNRALQLFNQSKVEVSDSNRLPMFLFGSLLGIHVLKETLAGHSGTISAFIEKFIHYLHLHRGIRAFICDQSWNQILQSDLKSLLYLSRLSQRMEDQAPGAETIKLRTLFDSYNARDDVIIACQSALQWIQWMLDVCKQDPSEELIGIHAILAWPIVIPEEYIDALWKHRPEAFAVLVFYAAALQRHQRFWVFGDSGTSLLSLLSSSIGSFWLGHLDL
ncbi:Upc2 protein [Boeremia exigua]|uniref:Upc2 protein n=1 Tax=Boeremia exigua TaxID=749465 RepID=UPI001E8CD3AC|nr:Upc2 protein [Boeremia exigua]KAH6620182.1 Upc2 protein [Boeremia exigua]